MKKVIPKDVWSSPIEIDLTNISVQSLLENLTKTLERIETIKEKIIEIKGTGFSDPVPASLSDLLDIVSGENGSGGSGSQNFANKTLDETITGSWTFTNQIQVPSIRGSNTQDLLITGKDYGVEIRIDEDDTNDNAFRITKGSGGSTDLLSVTNIGLTVGGFDISLGTADQSTKGNTGPSRALVKDANATLAINYTGDFTGGVRLDGPGLGIGGTNYVYNTNTSLQIPGADANAKWLVIRDTTSGSGVISFNNTKDADGNILGSLVWTREGGQSDEHRQVAGIVAVQSGTGGTAGSELHFYAKGTSGPVQAMVINISGSTAPRVGIGVTSPTVALDVSGDAKVSGTITGTLNGNASTATKLQTARTITLSGKVTGSTSFDGSANATINTSIPMGAVGTTELSDNSVTSLKLASGVFERRFIVSGLLPTSISLSANSSLNVQTIGLNVPTSRLLRLIRLRTFILSTGSGTVGTLRISTGGTSYDYNFSIGAGNPVDIGPNYILAYGSSYNFALTISFVNTNSTGINLSHGSGWWIEFSIE
jgi:hypothetical protein